MKQARRGLDWLLALGLLGLPNLAHAQATGALLGFVSDQSAAPLQGASISVTSRATGQTRNTTSGPDGFFSVPLLAPGRYDVSASLQGFASLKREGVRVVVSETARISLELKLGGLEESVTVVGEAPLVDPSNATLGIVIDERKIVDLPLNGRNFTQLGTLIPGVVAPPNLFGGSAGDADAGINGFGPVSSGFSVNGTRSQSNSFLLDGATNNDTFNTGFVLRPPPDAIQEFKILTHAYGAEYGRNAGSVVNVVTKSGSNEWHGSAWEFNRDDALEARNFFAPEDQEKPTLKQNQFGASLGGPLAKDKAFVFGYYEGFRNTRGTTRNITVLTEAQRSGNFAGSAPVIDPATGQPFPGNVIPANRLNPSATQIVQAFMPLPNSGTNRFVAAPDVEDERNQLGIRFDVRPSERHGLLLRYLWSKSDGFEPPVVEPIGTTAASKLQDVMLSHTFSISANAYNQFRFSFNKLDAEPTVTSGTPNSEFGLSVPNLNPLAVGLASINISGFPALGDPQQPFVKRGNETLQLANDFTYLRGRHSWKAGVELTREKMFIGFINRPNGDFTFTNRFTGNAAADFLLGLPTQFRQASPGADAINEGHGWSWAAYVQDEFRVSPRLTLNLGLRYELFQPFVDSGDALNAFRSGQQSTRFPEAPSGLVYPGDPGVPRGTYETDKNNFAPRVAFTWDLTGDSRTVLRAGWGLFYDALPGQGDFFQNAVLAPPFNPLLQVDAPPADLSFTDPLASVTGGATGFPPGIIFIGWGPDFATPYYHHYNLTLQRQFGDNVGVEVGWVGSRGRNLPIFIETNPFTILPGARRGPRELPAFSLVRPTFTEAESWYDSLQASVRLRPTNGITLLASYTWGHAIDHDSSLNVGGGEELRPILPVDIGDEASMAAALARERGEARFDVRHRFVVSFGVELPRFEDRDGFTRHVLGGWQLNGIIQAQTGFPFQVATPSTYLDGLTGRPDLLCDPNGGPKTVEQWFDTSCFRALTPAEQAVRQGDMGRNVVRGPGFNRVDLSLFKNIAIKGDHQLQLRVEAFNVFDRANFDTPGFRMGTSTFGVVTATNGDGRIVQLGVKYSF